MKVNKNIGYFVKLNEFKDIKKSPFAAGILSIFLGVFGIHRFYLKRKLTGFIFLALFILSKGYLAAIFMIISIIEGISYILTGITLLKERYESNKTKKNKYIEGLEEKIVQEKIKKDGEEKIEELEIIDISNIETSKIFKKNQASDVFKTDWIKKLNLPYERNIMEIQQIKTETLNLYSNLCDFIDDKLKNNRNSLDKESKRISREGGYYNNILYTIYCISEGHVTKAYSGEYHYNTEYSYDILEGNLGKNIRNEVFNKSQDLERNVSKANEDTLIYFNLTENGLPKEWWDMDGSLRECKEFNKEVLNILKATPSRSTKVWEIHEVNRRIIDVYIEIWKVILDGLEKDLKWKKKNKNHLKNIIEGKERYFSDYENGNILSSLLKISENTIREIMPSTQVLNIDKEKDNIKVYLPSKLVEDIGNKITEYKENIDNKNILLIVHNMIENDSSDWKLKVEAILRTENDKKIGLLIYYKEDENFIKIAKEVIKKTEDENLILLCLYGIEKDEVLSPKNKNFLKKFIHESNISTYEGIMKSKEELSLGLLDKLVELKNPIRKKIALDMDKVKDSKKELNETVEILKEYIGDEEEEEIEEEKLETEILKEDIKNFKYEDFLKLILDKGYIDLEEGKSIAMNNGTLLNAFISEVNRELYDHIQDQAIIIEEKHIKIDDFYVDMVRELVTNEA